MIQNSPVHALDKFQSIFYIISTPTIQVLIFYLLYFTNMRNRKLTVFRPSNIFSDDFDSFFMPRFDWNTDQQDLEMYEDDNNVVVKLAVPGFNEQDLDINIEDNVLTLSGNISQEEEQEDPKKKYYYKGIRKESFSRSVTLPSRVKSDKAEAEVKQGVLEIHLPKAEESKASKIMIKGKEK